MTLGEGVAAGCLFTFVGASRGHLCNSTAFLFNELSCWFYEVRPTPTLPASTMIPTNSQRSYNMQGAKLSLCINSE